MNDAPASSSTRSSPKIFRCAATAPMSLTLSLLILFVYLARRAESLQQLVHIEAEKGNTWPTAVHLSRQKEFFPRCAGGCLSLVGLRATGRAAQRATEALHRRGHRLQSAEASMLTDMGIVTMHAWRWCHPARCDRGGRQTGPREPGYCWISIALQKPL